MTSILQTQLYRLKKSKLYWVMLGVCAALPVISVLFIFGLLTILGASEDLKELFDMVSMLGANALSTLSSVASLNNDTSLLALICTAVVLCKEFTQGTVRNALLANKSRTELYLAYYVVAVIIGVSYFLAYFAFTLLAHGIVLGFGSMSAGSVVTAVLCHFVLGLLATLVVTGCVCLFLFDTCSMSKTIAFPLLICIFAPGIITSLTESIVTAMAFSGKQVSETALKCLPFYNLSQINPESPAGLAMLMTCIYYAILIAVFFVSSFFPFQKKDLK